MRNLRTFFVVAGIGAAMLMSVENALGQRGGGRGGGGRGGGGGRSGGGNMNNNASARPDPNQNPAVVADRQEISTIQTDLNKTNAQIDQAVKTATSDFQKTQEYIDAQKGVDAAASELQSSREAVLAKLKLTPEYKDAAAKEIAARAKLDQLKSNGASRDAISAQSSEILKLGGVTSKMERDILQSDEGYLAATKKLADANVTLKDLKDKLAEQIKADTNIAALKTTQTETQTKLADAQKKLSTDLASASGGK